MADQLMGVWPATVVAVETETRCRRIRARIEGMFDETPYWCQPAGMPGAGAVGQGSYYPVKLNQQVYLIFLHGDPMAGAIYLTGPYGVDSTTGLMPGPETINAASSVMEASKDIIIWEDEDFFIGVVYSERGGSSRKQIRLIEKSTSTGIVIDAADGADGGSKSVLIQATTAIRMSAMGLVNILGSVVQAQGRRVLGLTKKHI